MTGYAQYLLNSLELCLAVLRPVLPLAAPRTSGCGNTDDRTLIAHDIRHVVEPQPHL